jgi:2-C-methyl-D-erythritol 4-phosphate cytidylyltransferase
MPALAGIALSVPEDRIAEVQGWDFGLPAWVTAGGETRQESVASALRLLPDLPDAPVMIHDAVRPFPPVEPIRMALATLEDADGSLLAEASTDTLKRVSEEGFVMATEPRENIFRAQTPQIARLSTWRRAFAWADGCGFLGTDDVSILEAMGLRVKVIPSSASNLKLTTPEDWYRYSPQ